MPLLDSLWRVSGTVRRTDRTGPLPSICGQASFNERPLTLSWFTPRAEESGNDADNPPVCLGFLELSNDGFTSESTKPPSDQHEADGVIPGGEEGDSHCGKRRPSPGGRLEAQPSTRILTPGSEKSAEDPLRVSAFFSAGRSHQVQLRGGEGLRVRAPPPCSRTR